MNEKYEGNYYLYLYAISAFVFAAAALWTARHTKAVQSFVNNLQLPNTEKSVSGIILPDANQITGSQTITDGGQSTSQNGENFPGYFPMFAFAYISGSAMQGDEFVAATDTETIEALQLMESEALKSQQQQQAQSVAAQQIEAGTPTVEAGK